MMYKKYINKYRGAFHGGVWRGGVFQGGFLRGSIFRGGVLLVPLDDTVKEDAINFYNFQGMLN